LRSSEDSRPRTRPIRSFSAPTRSPSSDVREASGWAALRQSATDLHQNTLDTTITSCKQQGGHGTDMAVDSGKGQGGQGTDMAVAS